MKKSAGILAYAFHEGEPKVLIGHPGGPYFSNKEVGVWSIPKGEFEQEDPKTCALREFKEETNLTPPSKLFYLGEVKYRSGKKILYCWCGQVDYKEKLSISSNTFEMEWPPQSGIIRRFPEIDRARFVSLEEGRRLLHKDQVILLDRLQAFLAARKVKGKLYEEEEK